MGFIFALLLLSCASPHNPVSFKPAPVEPGGGALAAYYDLDVQRVFDRSCGRGCHEVDPRAGPQIGARQTGLVLTSDRAYESLFGPDGSKNGPLVLPGRPEDSVLIWKIETAPSVSQKRFGRRMPAAVRGEGLVDGEPLSAQEIALIRAWISAGARKTAVPSLPAVSGASSVDARTVEVTFGDPIEGAAPDLARRYSVAGGGLEALSAAVTGPRTVRLITSAQQPGVTYTLSVFGARGGPATFRFTPSALQVVRAASVDSITADVTFSEPVEASSAAQPGRYAIAGLTVQSATLRAADAVRLRTSPQQPGTTYTVIVSGVQSLKGGAIQAGQGDRATFRYVPPASFSRDVQPIFNANCAFSGCHAGQDAPYGLRLEAGLSYKGMVDVSSGTRPSVSRVKPGDPDNSLLVQKLEGAPGVGSRMPLGGGALPDADIQTIRAWIAAGAKDN